MCDDVDLIEPTEDLEEQYVAFVSAFRDAGETSHQSEWDALNKGFASFVQGLRNSAEGVGVAKGLVSWNTYWLVGDGEVLGSVRLRHRLTPALRIEGGHIGYAIRPDRRGRGLATRMLAMAMDKARARGLTRCMVTCNDENTASARVIEKNGGRRDTDTVSPRTGLVVRRYWIDL